MKAGLWLVAVAVIAALAAGAYHAHQLEAKAACEHLNDQHALASAMSGGQFMWRQRDCG